MINIKHIGGNNWKQKMDTIQKQIADIDEFIGIRLINVGKEQYITAEFGNKETMLAACNRQIELNSDYKLQPTLNYGDDDVKDRTLIVKDLPLNLNRYTLRQILEKCTLTNVINLKAKVISPYLKATVLFNKKEAVESLRNTWSINYLKDLVRIEPAQMSNEEREIREAHVMKLTNLPFGVTAYDLKTLIEAVKQKLVFYPVLEAIIRVLDTHI